MERERGRESSGKDQAETMSVFSTSAGGQRHSAMSLSILSCLWLATLHRVPNCPPGHTSTTSDCSCYNSTRLSLNRPVWPTTWSAARWAEKERVWPSRPNTCGANPGRTSALSSASTRTLSATCTATGHWRSCDPAWRGPACPGPPRSNGNLFCPPHPHHY